MDPVGIARALYNDVRGRGVQQGGSTITQQYVKNVYLTSERSVTRKVKEAVLAVKLERELDKQQILERYLNTIYFGRGAYGVGAASRAYFGKDVRQLGLTESAYLAGLIRAPEAADALSRPEEASRRRNVTLQAMLEEHKVTEAEIAQAKAVPWTDIVIPRRDRTKLDIKPGFEAIGGAYVVAAIQDQLLKKYGEGVLYGGGLRIYATVDPQLQRQAWDAVRSTLNQPDDPAAALVSIDDQGEIKAMVGGEDFEHQKVNYALGKAGGGSGRGAGSSFKPFTLAAAIQQGISLNSKFNAPSEITLPKANDGKDWVVHNYDDAEEGTLDLADALRVSSNTAFAQLMLKVPGGPQSVADLAAKMGVTARLTPPNEDRAVNSLVLGTADVSPLDMASGFSTFANRGVHNDPELISRIEQVGDEGGVTILEQSHASNDRVLPQAVSDQVTYAMRQVVLSGTGHAANFGKPEAGKTGTTQNHRDAWFVGFTPKLTTAVWMGYPNSDGEVRSMLDVHGIKVTGGSFPTQIWTKYMKAATAGKDQGSFTSPKTFPGKVLNEQLVQSTSSTSSSSTSSTLPGASTSTSSTLFPPATLPGSPSTSSTIPTTTTTGPSLPPCTKPFFQDPRYNQQDPSKSTCKPVG